MAVRLFQDIPDFEDPRVVREWDEDLTLVLDRGPPQMPTWIIHGDHAHRFTGYYSWQNARICGELLARGGTVESVDDDYVPVSVAIQGQAAIAAYLYCIQQFDKNRIVETMNLERSTVSQYISDFAKGKR